jgi:hypothetical protein
VRQSCSREMRSKGWVGLLRRAGQDREDSVLKVFVIDVDACLKEGTLSRALG